MGKVTYAIGGHSKRTCAYDAKRDLTPMLGRWWIEMRATP